MGWRDEEVGWVRLVEWRWVCGGEVGRWDVDGRRLGGCGVVGGMAGCLRCGWCEVAGGEVIREEGEGSACWVEKRNGGRWWWMAVGGW